MCTTHILYLKHPARSSCPERTYRYLVSPLVFLFDRVHALVSFCTCDLQTAYASVRTPFVLIWSQRRVLQGKAVKELEAWSCVGEVALRTVRRLVQGFLGSPRGRYTSSPLFLSQGLVDRLTYSRLLSLTVRMVYPKYLLSRDIPLR